MRKSWWLINLLLLAGAVGTFWKLRADWRLELARNGPQSIQPSRLPLPAAPLALAAPSYGNIAQQNPFSADRNDVVATPQAAAAAQGPPPLYLGSVILGSERFALLATGQGQDQGKAQRVFEGQTFDGYKVAAVRPESVVFQSAAGTSEVQLYNAILRIHRSFQKTLPQATATTSSSSAGPAVSTPASAAPAGSRETSVTSAPAAAPPPPPAAGNDTKGKHVEMTPFGPIWVKD